MNFSCASEQKSGEGSSLAGEKSLAAIGIQLYTVRNLMKEDFAGTLAKVAAAGYQEVEFAGYFDNSPADIKKLLDDLGLKAPAVHVPIQTIRENLAGAIEAAKTIGHQYIVCPWLAPEDRTTAGYQALAASLNIAGEACKNAGIQMCYHNHEFEFETVDGMIPYDFLLAETDAALVQMELDLFWIVKGKNDPLAYFEKHPGRFPLCHVKDMGDGESMVDVGQGHIDFAKIFAKSEQAGLKHYFVEHDNPADPLQSIQNSQQYLKNLKF
jgi:sugar phosphate isomerase/epimerase